MVEASNDTTAFLLRQIYNRTKSQSEEMLDGSVVAEYFGDINEDSISLISADIEAQLSKRLENKKITKRIFNIFIEGLQNIFKHGSPDSDEHHIGGCLLTKVKDSYHIHFMNVSPNSEISPMTEYLEFLNSLTMDQTKKFYMERLVNGNLTDRGGASLGYIIMKLKSNNNITYKFEKATELDACYHIEIAFEIAEKE